VYVGEITASAAGDQYLLSNALGLLQYYHATAALAGFHGAHQAGRSAAENDYIKILHKPCQPAVTP